MRDAMSTLSTLSTSSGESEATIAMPESAQPAQNPMPSIPPTIDELAQEWLRLDRDEGTKEEIRALLKDRKEAELEKRLRNRIAFGTAGLRARMEAGFSRLNSLTIIQASQGLAAYLISTEPSVAEKHGIVIGHDARHNSRSYARLAATAFIAKGIKVWWYEDLVHTPMVPFGVKHLRAIAGVMVTASHNPAQDNGYKVYWKNASQIIPPHDSGIASAILENLEPLSWDTSILNSDTPLFEKVLQPVKAAYFAAVERIAPVPPLAHEINFVYTPMHGVGLPYMQEIVERLRIETGMVVVSEQASPDPNFPTVAFPNPEEQGALDLAYETADRNGIGLVIANDPDADRLAVAEHIDGGWYQFTGNQLGMLLASYVLDTFPGDRSKLAMLTTAVSTTMLRHMASAMGFYFEETLTGFKWLGNRAQVLASQGFVCPFAFEEAIGYMFSDVVHDKDAISAGAVFLVATAFWRDNERLTPWEKLQQLYETYGFFESANTYLISPDAPTTAAVFERIRTTRGRAGSTAPNTPRSIATASPIAGLAGSPSGRSTPIATTPLTTAYTGSGASAFSPHSAGPPSIRATPSLRSIATTITLNNSPYPRRLGKRKILRWRDLTEGYDSATEDHIPLLPVSSSSQMITCELEGGIVFTIRGSGTEPKIKLYVECSAPTFLEAQEGADEVVVDLCRDWLRPDVNGLEIP